MKHLLALTVGLAAVATASAHFAYIVPAADGAHLQVVFSDTLEADTKVPIDRIKDTTLFRVDDAGKRAPLKWASGKHALTAELPAAGPAVVGGVCDFGFHQSKHTQNKPVRLKYYPKAILGDPGAAEKLRLGDAVPVEIVPVAAAGKLRFQVLHKGKPLPDAEVGVLVPGEAKGQKTTSDADGMTQAFDKPGRYGVWAAHFEAAAGEVGGKKYEEVRHYATLVVDLTR